MNDGETREIHIMSYELGTCEIKPRSPGSPYKKNVPVLRVHLWNTDKDFLPYYWDITSKHLIAGLRGYLESSGYDKKIYTIGKTGEAPRSRYTLAVRSI